jgi:hypothetical protein
LPLRIVEVDQAEFSDGEQIRTRCAEQLAPYVDS